jgi:hypothetical protein
MPVVGEKMEKAAICLHIGRIQRSEKAPVIFDYRDSKIDYFDKLFKQRNRHYRKLLKTR